VHGNPRWLFEDWHHAQKVFGGEVVALGDSVQESPNSRIEWKVKVRERDNRMMRGTVRDAAYHEDGQVLEPVR
jgi:hypothetical protein